MMTTEKTDAQLRRAMQIAALLQKQEARRIDPDTGLSLPRQWVPSPEHYHLIYHVPKDSVSVPDFKRRFEKSKPAYQAIFDMAQQAEPNVEYYDDGTIGMEMRMHGRAGLTWVVMEVGACMRNGCGGKTPAPVH
jgi:hypothetical protein